MLFETYSSQTPYTPCLEFSRNHEPRRLARGVPSVGKNATAYLATRPPLADPILPKPLGIVPTIDWVAHAIQLSR
jgi:hypothetical protein